LLRLNDQARWAIGCTIDADRISLAGVDLTGALRARIAVPLGPSPSSAEIGEALRGALAMLRPEAVAGSATGLGIAVPYGSGTACPALLRELTEGLDMPVISANSPACAA